MEITLKWKSEFQFEIENDLEKNVPSCISLNHPNSFSPYQLFLLAIASDSGMDILRKLKDNGHVINEFSIKLKSDIKFELDVRKITDIRITYLFGGKCDSIAVLNAVEYSQFVSRGILAMLEKIIPIHWVIVINGKELGGGMATSEGTGATI